MASDGNSLSLSLTDVHEAIDGLETPKDLFSGMMLREAFAPDNILFFRRTDTQAFSPGGVNNNYHHRFELVVVVKNGGAARIGDKSCFLEAGEAVLIFPNQFHHYMDVKSGDLEWLFITFELPEVVEIGDLKESPRLLDANALGLIERLLNLKSAMDQRGIDHTLGISYTLSCLLKYMVDLPMIPEDRLNIHSTDDSRDKLLEQINEIVRKNLNRQITIEDMALELGYSVSYLRALFRNKLGISLGKYIRESRLSRSAQLLMDGGMTVTEVAAETGFESLFAFSRAFKNAYGISPKAYSRIGK